MARQRDCDQRVNEYTALITPAASSWRMRPSSGLSSPSPPAEKATARKDQGLEVVIKSVIVSLVSLARLSPQRVLPRSVIAQIDVDAEFVRPFLKRLFASRVPLSDEHRL
jgi:hypothetical protein